MAQSLWLIADTSCKVSGATVSQLLGVGHGRCGCAGRGLLSSWLVLGPIYKCWVEFGSGGATIFLGVLLVLGGGCFSLAFLLAKMFVTCIATVGCFIDNQACQNIWGVTKGMLLGTIDSGYGELCCRCLHSQAWTPCEDSKVPPGLWDMKQISLIAQDPSRVGWVVFKVEYGDIGYCGVPITILDLCLDHWAVSSLAHPTPDTGELGWGPWTGTQPVCLHNCNMTWPDLAYPAYRALVFKNMKMPDMA